MLVSSYYAQNYAGIIGSSLASTNKRSDHARLDVQQNHTKLLIFLVGTSMTVLLNC